MLRYSQKAIPALVRLYQRFNDITIFVEDATYTNMYRSYFGIMLDGKANIRKVLPLEGKNNVIEACKSGRYSKYEPAIYLIDGDIDLLMGNTIEYHKNLYRLELYCAENLLVSEKSIIEVAYDSSPDLQKIEIKKKLRYENWLCKIEKQMLPLYLTFAANHYFEAGATTTGLSMHSLCDGKKPDRSLCSLKIRQKIESLELEILKVTSRNKLNLYRRGLKKRIASEGPNVSKYFSGKTSLLPLLYVHLKNTFEFPDSKSSLKLRLARYPDFTLEKGLPEKIMSICGETREECI